MTSFRSKYDVGLVVLSVGCLTLLGRTALDGWRESQSLVGQVFVPTRGSLGCTAKASAWCGNLWVDRRVGRARDDVGAVEVG